MELLLEMFPACTVSQVEKALAMALGNLEEAVQLIVDKKVEIGPAGVSVKVLYSELGGSRPKSRGAEFRNTRVPQLSAAGRSFDHRNFLHSKLQDHPEQYPLSLPYLSRGCAHTAEPASQQSCGWHPLLRGPECCTSCWAPQADGEEAVHPTCCATHALVFPQELTRPRRAPNHEELKQVILQK